MSHEYQCAPRQLENRVAPRITATAGEAAHPIKNIVFGVNGMAISAAAEWAGARTAI